MNTKKIKYLKQIGVFLIIRPKMRVTNHNENSARTENAQLTPIQMLSNSPTTLVTKVKVTVTKPKVITHKSWSRHLLSVSLSLNSNPTGPVLWSTFWPLTHFKFWMLRSKCIWGFARVSIKTSTANMCKMKSNTFFFFFLLTAVKANWPDRFSSLLKTDTFSLCVWVK